MFQDVPYSQPFAANYKRALEVSVEGKWREPLIAIEIKPCKHIYKYFRSRVRRKIYYSLNPIS